MQLFEQAKVSDVEASQISEELTQYYSSLAHAECDDTEEELWDKEDAKCATAIALLDDDVDILELDLIDITIRHSRGEDEMRIVREPESGTWMPLGSITLLPSRYASTAHDEDWSHTTE